jgi:hypothetical protein
LRVLLYQACRIESRPMRTQVTPAERRVARQAVALDVTADTRLEALARCAAVPGNEKLIGIVVAVA